MQDAEREPIVRDPNCTRCTNGLWTAPDGVVLICPCATSGRDPERPADGESKSDAARDAHVPLKP